ncbi:MAG: CoA-binding protein, partial [Candidatus Micrarchaeales archaeon]
MPERFNLTPMLKPKSVAIIGASRNPEKVGNIILQNYISAGYSGKLYPVNLNAEEVLGLKAYKTVLEIGSEIDLAVIAIPAPVVPMALEQCGKAKVKSAIVVSGGFAEIGETKLQDQISEIAKKYKMPLLGPNCLGVVDTRSRTDTMFLPSFKISRPQVGFVSFVSQSGAVGSTVLDIIGGEGFGLSKFISYGNAAYVDEVDILQYLMDDIETKVIIFYLEGIKRGKEFVELARKITKKKPVIILKAGRTDAGIAAAHSHTASLAGNYAVQEAIFKQFGFTVANDLNELIYYAKAFASEIEPAGNRVAVITNGGGTGVITADAIGSSRYLKMAEYSNQTKKTLRKSMPPLVNITNPLDLAGDADEKRYEDAFIAIS